MLKNYFKTIIFGITFLKREVGRFGPGILWYQALRLMGKMPVEKVFQYKEEKYYSKLSREEQIKDLQELYNMHGLDDDIMAPKTFTGKIEWLKFNDDLDIRARLSDKYEVRKWISENIGDKYLIPLIDSWERVEDIDFSALPNRFVFKANHGSGFNYIVRDKSTENWDDLKKKLQAWLDTPFGWNGMELQYHRIKRRIIAEEYIEQIDGGLLDYKVHCFNGNPEFIQVIGDRDLVKHTGKQANYDFDWNLLPWILEDYPAFQRKLEKPAKLDELFSVSRRLSKDFRYVRVDLYFVDNEVKFGEMTFTPGDGLYPYKGTWTREIDLKLGEKIPTKGE